MAKILQFPTPPTHTYNLNVCAGCNKNLTDDYWEVDLPTSSNHVDHIALCGSCYEDAATTGIFD